MTFPETYTCLTQNEFEEGDYKIVPIRYEDRKEIMKWRNEQMYHLRQAEPLTEFAQDNYFQNIVSKLFEEDKPSQILFSYLKDDVCIGYGGLVHINWVDSNAEISFIMKTELESVEFGLHWSNYLGLIESLGFGTLKLHKLFVYAFDLRPHLYNSLLKSNYFQDAILKEHCYFNGKFLDVIIHSKLKS